MVRRDPCGGLRADGQPAEERTLGYEFAGGIRLDSLTLYDRPADAGGLLRVETRWATDSPPLVDYTLFFHLLTLDGRAIVGQDGPPANGYRPVTGWQPGEIVADRRALAVPGDSAAGLYALEIGLYDAATGERLPVVVDGAQQDRVLIRDIGIAGPES